MRRAEKESIITLDIAPEEEVAVQQLEKQFVKVSSPAGEQVALAVKDAYKRLLKPSLETEVRVESKMKADQEAIKVFSSNLKNYYLLPLLVRSVYLRLIPGFEQVPN